MNMLVRTNQIQRAATALLATVPLVTAALLIPLLDNHLPFDSDTLSTLSGAMLVSGLIAWMAAFGGLTISQRFAQAGLRAQLAIPVLAGMVTALAGAVITARMMLVTERDLVLLSLLLLFAALISLPVAWWTAGALTRRVADISWAAKGMAEGQLGTRVLVTGNDEVGQLAQSFNSMAEQIERARGQQAAIEQARKEMLVAISHDLRTPLSSIRAMGEAILDDVVDEPTGHHYMKQILTETDKLSLLINDLFELSQINVGNLRLQLEPSDIRDSLSDTLNAMQLTATRKGVELRGDFSHPVPLVLADSARIQRVLTNLIQNALHHTKAGGTVTLRADDACPDVLVTVEDTGSGINPDELPHIFEGFYRVDRARSDGGAGLGLTIAKGIIEGHGGRIWANSVCGKGTTIQFTLPSVRP
jgi:signal transduction histidine kinase